MRPTVCCEAITTVEVSIERQYSEVKAKEQELKGKEVTYMSFL